MGTCRSYVIDIQSQSVEPCSILSEIHVKTLISHLSNLINDIAERKPGALGYYPKEDPSYWNRSLVYFIEVRHNIKRYADSSKKGPIPFYENTTAEVPNYRHCVNCHNIEYRDLNMRQLLNFSKFLSNRIETLLDEIERNNHPVQNDVKSSYPKQWDSDYVRFSMSAIKLTLANRELANLKQAGVLIYGYLNNLMNFQSPIVGSTNPPGYGLGQFDNV